MNTIFGVPTPALYGQILIGLINGSFYAMLSLGLAVIFGLLRVINFAHGRGTSSRRGSCRTTCSRSAALAGAIDRVAA